MDKPKIRRARVQQKREVRIHSELWHTANCLLEAGQKDIKGSTHQFRASLVFRAFFLEAFLNWLGQLIVPHWSYLERLKPKEKLDLLNGLIHVTPDYGSRPWQIVKELFAFRNDLAHGKPEILLAESVEDVDGLLDGKLGHIPETEWEKFSTQENAVRAKKDVEAIANLLYKQSHVEHDGIQNPFSFGSKINSATLE